MKIFINTQLPSASLLASIALFQCLPLPSWAQEITPKLEIAGALGIKTYENVRVMLVTEQGVKVSHDAGISLLPFASIPKDWLAKHVPETPTKVETPKSPPPSSISPQTPTGPNSLASTSSFDPSCLVIIRTNGASGSGFIAKADGKTYVYTNAHVICGSVGGFTSKIVSIKTASGRIIPTPYDLELSDMSDPNSEHGLDDVARFPIVMKDGETAYEIGNLEPRTSMNQKVVAYGNSLGGDVITSLEGQILGLGTDRIEISCEIVPGNSGGPVVLDQTKQVIGISTYGDASGKRDIWSKGTTFDKVRRFAMRPEKVTKWRKMLYTSLMSSLADLNAFDRDTLSLAAACFLNPKPNNGGFDMPTQQKGDFVVKQVIIDGTQHPLGSAISSGIAKVNQRMGAPTAHMSVAGVVPIFSAFFNSVAQASSSQIESLKSADRAPYIKKQIPQLIQSRSEVHEQFVREGVTRFR